MKEERKPCLHAHVKWFYGQSERAYYLNYFINGITDHVLLGLQQFSLQ